MSQYPESFGEETEQEKTQRQMAETWSNLTDAEAKQHVAELKAQIKEVQTSAELGKDPRKVMELRELMTTLSWCRKNKLRSRFFRVITNGASMRQARRHPDARSFKSSGKTGQKRKTVQADPISAGE